jgi:hypothetical protein
MRAYFTLTHFGVYWTLVKWKDDDEEENWVARTHVLYVQRERRIETVAKKQKSCFRTAQ